MEFYLIAETSALALLASKALMVISVALGIGVVIFVHELGHFLVAKLCGVKCEKFYIGFDVPIKIGPIAFPRTLGKFRWGETEYGIGIIPLGGYVKMLGQDDNPANAQIEAERILVRKDGLEKEQASTLHSRRADGYMLDPRSYPAKSVPKRMAIISAGVIMNVIFAVIFATIAYRSGVKIMPCEIGGTVPGDPAWVVGLQPGDKVVQIGKSGVPNEHLRFQHDMRAKVVRSGLGGPTQPLDLLVRRGSEEPRWLQITASNRLGKLDVRNGASLGVVPVSSTRLSEPAAQPESAAALATSAFQPGDTIVAIDGEALPRDPETDQIYVHQLMALMAKRLSEPVTLTVARKGSDDAHPETVQISLPPEPMRTLGLVMEIGPIAELQTGSPAEDAGFRRGDILLTMNGQEVGDPLTLPQRVAALLGTKIVFEVRRLENDKPQTVTVEVTPIGPPTYLDRNFGPGCRASLDNLGIAYEITPKVKAVEPGSSADSAKLQAGDEVVTIRARAETDEVRKQVLARFSKQIFKEPLEIGKLYNWVDFHELLQVLPSEVVLDVTYRRGTTENTVPLVQKKSEQWFNLDRGLKFSSFDRVHRAGSWSEAMRLGVRESKEAMFQVLDFLGMLCSGKLPLSMLGGPIMIATAAGSEANEGMPRLLLFLTMLSVNLAILNFLPIPALDGGHMMFLAWEGVTGRPVNERVQTTLTLIGVVGLLCLMVFVFGNDIHRLFLS